MKKILYTTTAFILCGIAQSQAACIATPSCTSLGYTSTSSCTNGIKCPFGNYWNCDLANKINELEQKIEQSQGNSGDASSTCKIGSILFSDKTCGDEAQYGKTPIGVVVYLGGSGGQALALENVENSYKWSSEYTEIGCKDMYNSCENTKKIIAAGDKNTYQAAWAAHEYSTEGTKAGDWCLPAAGILETYYYNKEKIDNGFYQASGSAFSNLSSGYDGWSSTESASSSAYHSKFGVVGGLGIYDKKKFQPVRPVLEF